MHESKKKLNAQKNRGTGKAIGKKLSNNRKKVRIKEQTNNKNDESKRKTN